MNNPEAQHIFDWASSSAEHYQKMKGIAKYPRGGNFTTAAAGMAFALACETYRDMKNDRAEFCPTSILDAAKLFLDWEGEI